MKILFNPSFDSGYYINLSTSLHSPIGLKVVGLVGLLEYLSLRNGLSGRFVSDGERAASYMSYVSKCVGGTMVESAFKNDSLGVSKSLLQWRDKLIMSGWTLSQAGTDSMPKFKLLSDIELLWQAKIMGTADRWSELLALTQQHSIVEDNDVIECTCSKGQIPLLVRKVLETCNATFAEYPEEVLIPDSLDIKVIHYNDLSDAYRQVASHTENYKDSVIINRDNVSLNHILFSWGKPLVDAVIKESNPLTLQLFKLSLSVFSRPLNIQNILSYLLLPEGPVPRQLRTALANVLISNGGFGEVDWDDIDEGKAKELKEAGVKSKWDVAIYNYVNDEDDASPLTKVERASKTTLLRYITDDSVFQGQMINIDDLKNYIAGINEWAAGKANNLTDEESELKSQLSTVVSYFKQLSKSLSGIDKISYKDLERQILTIYQPISIRQAKAQVSSLTVIDDYSQLLDAPESLVWLDCCGADEMIDDYEFLSTTERMWLNGRRGIQIPKVEDILELNRKEMIYSISKVKSDITLITSDYYLNKKMTEHPLIAELKMQRGNNLKISEGDTSLPLSGSKDIKKVEPKLLYELGPIKYAGRNESNTSIDTLINYPFDYTTHYVARLGEPSRKELGSLNKAIGDVAHHFIQSLVNQIKGLPKDQRRNAMKSLLSDEYYKCLDNSIRATGLLLLLKENEMEYKNLIFMLKRSVETLISIMENKHLIPVGCELKYAKPLGKVINDFNARIDMVLEDADGNSVIFDFKWSYSTFYGEKIKEGTAIQLELYRRELEQQGKTVSAVGYYMLPKCVLETADYPTLKDKKTGEVVIQHIDPPCATNLFDQIENSVEQRMKEIKAGNIEEGEEMNIFDLSYSQELINGKDMLVIGTPKRGRKTKNNPDPPIEAIKKESKKVFTSKPESRFNKYTEHDKKNAPLNEKPTTYPLMKGRLK